MKRIYCPADGRINIDKFEEIMSEIERISQKRNNRPHHVGKGSIHKQYYHEAQSPYKHHLNF